MTWEKADKGNAHAKDVLQSWADAEWFTSRPEVPKKHHRVSIFKVALAKSIPTTCRPRPTPGAARHSAARLAMHKNARPGITPEEDGKRGPVKFIEDLRAKGQPGGLCRRRGRHRAPAASRPPTRCCGSPAKTFLLCRTSALAACAWAARSRRSSTTRMEDSGALPIELDVSQMNMGDVIESAPYDGKALKDGKVIAEFQLKSDVLFDEVRAGGRIP
jgi:aconitate hydratase 2/2-methylisocitrate dehydratase